MRAGFVMIITMWDKKQDLELTPLPTLLPSSYGFSCTNPLELK